MTVSLIAAVAANRVIGSRGAIPWRLPGDMARFRKLTMGHPVIMGRATFQSLGRPLAGRVNIVLSRDPSLRLPGCRVVRAREEALAAAAVDAAGAPTTEPEAFVIGGAEVYSLFLPIADRLYMTWVDAEIPGDTFFPEVAWEQWQVTGESAPGPARAEGVRPERAGTETAFPHRFVDYARRTQ